MRLIDIDELVGCAIIKPMSRKDMGHILSCSNILIHTEIPTAYDTKHEQEIRNKAIEEMLGQIEIRFLGVHPDKLYWGYTPSDVVDICKEIAEEMKEVDNG